MRILGVGIDMVRISRMEDIIARRGHRFLERVFTAEERTYCLKKSRAHVCFSGRFAVKEALLKALGTGLSAGVSWKDIETLRQASGPPAVRLSGRVRELADKMGVSAIFPSITHDGDYAVAQVILEGRD
ncbi:MAG: holo-ACP synthase [Nitrospiria bacterium]